MSEPKLKGLDLHSEEVQELMGAVPSWIQRWGITLIALILIGALALCATIRLPERYEIELIPLTTDWSATISMPESVKIKRIYVADNASVKANDTLIEYTNGSTATAPIAGQISYIGPLHIETQIPSGTELLKISAAATADSLIYYAYIPKNLTSKINIGQTVTIPEIGSGIISIVAHSPDTQGNHYIEIITSGSNYTHTPLTTNITVSSETILQKLLTTISHKAKIIP